MSQRGDRQREFQQAVESNRQRMSRRTLPQSDDRCYVV